VIVSQDSIRSHSEPVCTGTGEFHETMAQDTRSVAACIVLYNPGPEVRLTLCSVLPQVSKVLVIDSASKPESEVVLTGLCAEFGVVLIANKDNVGRSQWLRLSWLCCRLAPTSHQRILPSGFLPSLWAAGSLNPARSQTCKEVGVSDFRREESQLVPANVVHDTQTGRLRSV